MNTVQFQARFLAPAEPHSVITDPELAQPTAVDCLLNIVRLQAQHLEQLVITELKLAQAPLAVAIQHVF